MGLLLYHRLKIRISPCKVGFELYSLASLIIYLETSLALSEISGTRARLNTAT